MALYADPADLLDLRDTKSDAKWTIGDSTSIRKCKKEENEHASSDIAEIEFQPTFLPSR